MANCMEDFSSSDEYTSDSEEDTVDFDEAFLRMKPCTGHYHKAKPKVVDYIDRLTDQAIGLFWIGKTSGGERGCRARWYDKYEDEGMNRMAIVYRTNDQDYALQMEKYLIDVFEDDVENETGGGGGKKAKHNPPYVVYIAWEDPE